jgi:hypothetical protein
MRPGSGARTNVEAIIRFVCKQDIALTVEQEELFVRVSYTDNLLRSRKYKRDDIIRMIIAKYQVSNYRAAQDITDAHKIFGETRRLNKNYLISHHIEDIGLQIQAARDTGRLDLLPKLNDNFNRAIELIPDEPEDDDIRPARIIYVFEGAPAIAKKDLTAVLEEADKMIKGITDADYLEFEELGRSKRENHPPGPELSADGSSAGGS